MSSFYENYLTEIAVIIFACTALLLIWEFYFRHWYIGCGVRVAWSYKLNQLVVVSRLINSPAHKHGVQRGMTVISLGQWSTTSFQEFQKCKQTYKPRRGVTERWVFSEKERLHPANLTPVFITSGIPAYWHPDVEQIPSSENIKGRTRYDPHIGEYYVKPKMTR